MHGLNLKAKNGNICVSDRRMKEEMKEKAKVICAICEGQFPEVAT